MQCRPVSIFKGFEIIPQRLWLTFKSELSFCNNAYNVALKPLTSVSKQLSE